MPLEQDEKGSVGQEQSEFSQQHTCFSWKFSGLQVALCLAVRSTACLTSLAGRGQRSEHTDVLGCFICASPSSAFIQLETLWLCPRITVQIPVKRLVAIKDFIIFFCQDLRAANTNSEGNFAFSGDSLACPFHKGVVSQPDGAGAAQLPKLDVPRSLRFSAHHFRAQNLKENRSVQPPARCGASTTAPFLLLQMHPDHFAPGKINT